VGSKTALITGASSGIGYELAKLFARDEYSLVLVAKNESRLERVGEELIRAFGVSVKWIAKDLSSPNMTAELVEEIEREAIEIDVLVNNAGFGTYGYFMETDAETERAMMQLNMFSLTYLSKWFVKKMLVKGEGKILNVASTAAFQPGPLMAVYYATKAYVLSFSEAVANELRETQIKVSVLCPGPTRTEFQRRSGAQESILDWGAMDAATVATLGYRGLMRNQPVIIPGLLNKLLAFGVRFTPRQLATQIVRFLQGGRKKPAIESR
jgi:uncharacterized protein